jgi:pyruvate,water dikinase
MSLPNLLKHWIYGVFAPGIVLKQKYEAFRELLEYDRKSHELMAGLEQLYYDRVKTDFAALESRYNLLSSNVENVVNSLMRLSPTSYGDLAVPFKKIDSAVRVVLTPRASTLSPPFVLRLDEVGPRSQSAVGGKAHNLALARKKLGQAVPNGVVIAADAYHYVIESNDLRGRINEKLAVIDIGSVRSLEKISGELGELVRGAEIPRDLEVEIHTAVEGMFGQGGGSSRFSVRSSAVGEDSPASFAGQYRTLLNVDSSGIVPAYRKVIASKYSSRALYYRIQYGLPDQDTPMAALILPTIDAVVSGVMYTRDPGNPDTDTLALHIVWGLGEVLADGSVTPGVIAVRRDAPHLVERTEKTDQAVMTVPATRGGTKLVSVTGKPAPSLALEEGSIRRLAEWAMELENFFGGPQDIEWCMDGQGELFILQCRPLQVSDRSLEAAVCENVQVGTPVLLSGGTKACGGIGAGVVHLVERANDVGSLGEGDVLVTSTPSPDFVKVLRKLSAVVTDLGSTAGHFASVAREFGVPTLVNTGVATQYLTPGHEVTVDADAGVVYQGRVEELLERACADRSLFTDTPFRKKLRGVLDSVSPLNLTDPTAENFAAEGCKTIHDLLRFCHEKSVEEMFVLGTWAGRRAKGAKKLVSPIPITMRLLDLGTGLRRKAQAQREVEVQDILCLPFRAVWKGLSHPDIYWDPKLKHLDWREFDRISAGIVQLERLGSYAIVSGDYLNVHIHFGYHFVVMDTLCGHEHDTNYIALRFAGGGADPYSRSLRVKFLGEILARLGFTAEIKGDLIEARVTGGDIPAMEARLETIGSLLGCTRLLDMALRDESDVDTLVEEFMGGNYDLSPITRK